MEIDEAASLESFRRFVFESTCKSFAPKRYRNDPEVFAERGTRTGKVHVEAEDKLELRHIRGVTFVSAADVLGIIYSSKSGGTFLKWRQTDGAEGRVVGTASERSAERLAGAGITAR